MIRSLLAAVILLAMPCPSLVAGETGACCYSDELCTDIPLAEGEIACDLLGGTWLGEGTSCEDGDCLIGACCFTDFEYYCEELVSQNACESDGGTFLGQLSTCDNEGSYCQTYYGACCVDYTDCLDSVSEEKCWFMGGEFIGADTTCSNNAPWCTYLFGACCFGDYCLELVEESDCESSGGTFWYGPCDEFSDVPECVATPRGACCVGDTTCETDVTEHECDQMNGQYYGDDTTDCPDSCEDMALGACCLDTGCDFLPDFLCTIAGGTFFPYQPCEPGICPTCSGDLDGDGFVGVNDLLALLAAFGVNGSGDCDGDEDTDIDDVLYLINAWGECL